MIEVWANPTTDCASKLRVRYKFSAPLDLHFLDLFSDGESVVNNFSRQVAGAKDHFAISYIGRMHASGVIGDTGLTATFFCTNESEPHSIRLWLESRLKDAGYLIHPNP